MIEMYRRIEWQGACFGKAEEFKWQSRLTEGGGLDRVLGVGGGLGGVEVVLAEFDDGSG